MKEIYYNDKKNPLIFLDSGAFSFRSYGLKAPPIESYIKFIKEKEPALSLYANMDVIGDAVKTWENQKIMEDAGLHPIPVYHPLADPIKYLHKCMEYDYFAIGGVAGNPALSVRLSVLDNCWDIITDDKGFPKNKVHGFGLAAPVLMMRYPWFSIDTSSFMDYGQYGIVLMPRKKYGKYCYNVPPVKVFVTHRSPKKTEEGKHFDSLTKNEQKQFLNYLKEHGVEYGTSEFKEVEKGYKHVKGVEVFANKERTLVEVPMVEGICNTNFWRDTLNFFFYLDIANQCPDYPWAFKKVSNNRIF